MLADLLPEDMKHYADSTLDKKKVKKLFTELAHKHPDQYSKILSDIGKLSFRVATDYGRSASPGLDDMEPPPGVKKKLNVMRNKVDEIKQSPDLTSEQKRKKIVNYVSEKEKDIQKSIIEEGAEAGNSFAMGTKWGWKANPYQLTQLLAGDMINVDVKGRPVSVPGLSGYTEGLTTEEQMSGAHGSMMGMSNVQEMTRHAGYLCLEENTLVRMSDGNSKPILRITKGEWVTGFDKKGNVFPVEVTEVFDNGYKPTFLYFFQDRYTDSYLTVESTPRHRIYGSKKSGESYSKLPIEDLDYVYNSDNGRMWKKYSRLSRGNKRVFDLEVNHKDHMFVLANGIPVENSKQLTQMVENEQITGEDCGAENVGVIERANEPNNFGMVLARPVGEFPSGTPLTERVASKIGDKEILLRSPITCQQRYGICQKCAGWNEENKFPQLGDFIGLTAGSSTTEPMTQQLGLASKHSGGTSALRRDKDSITPFQDIDQLYKASERFKGAIASPVEGKVEEIRTHQDGWKELKIGSTSVQVPAEDEIQVSKGDKVKEGDKLTDGELNPVDIVKYNSIGEARKQFANQQYKVFDRHGLGITPRQSSILSKGFIGHVKITDPEGIGNLPPGKIVTYAEMQDEYRPRKDSKELYFDSIENKYLEQPVLHYTIGTKVTPEVQKNLKKYSDKNKITVNDKPPGFEPYLQRASNMAAISDDWKTRMSGFNIHESFKDAAMTGSTSPRESPGYISELMNPIVMRRRLQQTSQRR